MTWRGLANDRRGSGPAWLAVALLGLLVLWLLLRLVQGFLPGHADAGKAANASAEAGTAGAPSRSLASWHLFGDTPPSVVTGGGALSGTLNLILRGTVAEVDPAEGIAVVAIAGGEERALRVGDEAAPGTTLAAVLPDRAVFRHAGGEETLYLPRDRLPPPGGAVPPAPAQAGARSADAATTGRVAASAPGAPARSPGGANRAALREVVAAARRDPSALLERVRVEPVFNGGRLGGLRLAAASSEDAALLREAGLQAGDVVTRVDGQPIRSLASGQGIAARLAGAGTVQVTVLRNGQPLELSLSLQ